MADHEAVMMLDAIRGFQAGREFYVSICTFATITKHFEYNTDPRISPTLRAQRKLQEPRIPDITNYILENKRDYIFSAITVSVDGKLQFSPAPGTGSEGMIGKLHIPLDAPKLINDGQHRCAAIRKAFEKDVEVESEKIAVVIFEDRGLERSQQMFADLNKHATRPTKSLGLLYDHRDTYARFIRNLVNDVEVFSGRTEMEQTNMSNRSTKFVTLNGVADATRRLIKVKEKAKTLSPEKQQLAVKYWTKVAANIPEWNLLVQNSIKPADLRKKYVHAHTNILNALGMAGNVLTSLPDWEERIKGLQKIDWKKEGRIWQDNVVVDGKMIKNRLAIKKAGNAILGQLGVEGSVEG